MTSDATLDHDYSDAVGRTQIQEEFISLGRIDSLARTLDLEIESRHDTPVPPGWHWMFFNPSVRRSELGVDGHPKRGGFLPDVTLPRRMWAGGRLRYDAPLLVGAPAVRESEILAVSSKSGRAGQLVFVTVRHTITQGGNLCIEEEQDIVYREAPTPGAPAPRPEPAPADAQWSETVEPDPVLLFRYSALTWNGHRIHYDRPYAQQEECYRDLVVHGPLTATLLQGLAERRGQGRRLTRFSFRGMAPLFVDRAFHVEARAQAEGDGLLLWARGPDGELAMRAEAVLAG